MTKGVKLQLIGQFKDLASVFDDVPGMGDDMVRYRPPAIPDAWSTAEQIVHCVDFDAANFHRYRWAIVKPGTQVLSFDQAWTANLGYQTADVREAIGLIKTIRTFMASHLASIADEDWTAYSYSFADGTEFNLEEALKHYVNHVAFHRDLIDRNIRLFHGQ